MIKLIKKGVVEGAGISVCREGGGGEGWSLSGGSLGNYNSLFGALQRCSVDKAGI